MLLRIVMIAAFLAAPSAALAAQDFGPAADKGTLERQGTSGKSEWVTFSPRFSHAYVQHVGGSRYTWLVLTEKEPPVGSWATAKDPHEARRLWCDREKTPFVAIMLTPDFKVNQYMLCPADGSMNSGMPTSWNGLENIAVTFQVRKDRQLKGTLRTGEGSCSDAKGNQNYCNQTGDYTFDAVVSD